MVRISAGSFMMGSSDGEADEKPVHKVNVASFEIDLTEVTVKAYRSCVTARECAARTTISAGGNWSSACNFDKADRDNHPMNCVDWSDAERFCKWAGKRLPTEEEWEYAARGTRNRKYPWGGEAPSAQRLNACGPECVIWLMKDNLDSTWSAMYSDSDSWPTTAPVGSFAAGDSPFGLHDMAGNVWEWTASCYCPYNKAVCATYSRVARGGGWGRGNASHVRAAHRDANGPSIRDGDLGFRCAR